MHVGYDVEMTDPQRDRICKGEQLQLPATTAPSSVGASAEWDSAGRKHGWSLGRSPQRDPADPGSCHPVLLNLSHMRPNLWESPSPNTQQLWGATARPCAGVSRATWVEVFLGIGIANPLLSVPYFDMFLKKRQKKKKKKNRKQWGKKGKKWSP